MAKKTPDGKESAEIKKLKKEDEVTAEKTAAVHQENVEAEAAKLKAAQEESDDSASPVAVPAPLPDAKRKKAWELLVSEYEKNNPVKFALKKKRGEFDKIPDSFTGKNELKLQG